MVVEVVVGGIGGNGIKEKVGECVFIKEKLGGKDDLIVLCNGDIHSVKIIKIALEEFSSISG
ncbi:hypothetical protein Tco_1188611, partial [Tanacetum coccineum]